jgi:enoyl-CoA hydratase/carnithine racemase
MTLFGQRLSGDEAARRGLVWKCLEDGGLLEEACSLAGWAASVPAALVSDLKATLRDLPSILMHGEAVERELEPQLRSLVSTFKVR